MIFNEDTTVFAIDPSYKNTGIVINHKGNIYFESFCGLEPKKGKKGQPLKSYKPKDVRYWTSKFLNIKIKYKNDKYVLLYGIMGSSLSVQVATDLAKLVGILELTFENRLSVYEQTARKHVLGRGTNSYVYVNGKKEIDVSVKKLAETYFEQENGIPPESDDISDAFVIFKYFENHYNEKTNLD